MVLDYQIRYSQNGISLSIRLTWLGHTLVLEKAEKNLIFKGLKIKIEKENCIDYIHRLA